MSIKNDYEYKNEIGDARIKLYNVFPGIFVSYNSIHIDEFKLDIPYIDGNYLEIHHCMEGRIEQEYENDFFYLMPGDLSISKRKDIDRNYIFPLNHYHGLTIFINIDIASSHFSDFLNNDNIKPINVYNRLCNNQKCVIIRKNSLIEHIFLEIYTINEDDKIDYLKIKILELLYVLSFINVSEAKTTVLYKGQVELAKKVSSYLNSNIDKRITIKELSRLFNISQTSLKTLFKAVYGVGIFSYTRIHKMQCAAQMLINSDLSISDLAHEFGYNNESKFSQAFKEIIGDSPTVYRKMHTKVNIL